MNDLNINEDDYLDSGTQVKRVPTCQSEQESLIRWNESMIRGSDLHSFSTMEMSSQGNNDTTIGNPNTFTQHERVSRAPRSESDAITDPTP